MISSLYFLTLGIWLTINVSEQSWGMVGIVVLGFFVGVRYLAPRKLSKDTTHNLASLAMVFACLDSSYLIGDPKVKSTLMRFISEVAVNTCKDEGVSYEQLKNRWADCVAAAKKEVKELGNKSKDS